MKKSLAIFLTLAIIVSAFFCAPMIISSATGDVAPEVRGEEIANGTWTLSEGGVDYLRTTAGWGSYTGSNGSVTITDPNSCRSTMTEIKGLTIGDTYCISFTGNGIVAAYVVLDYDSAYFNVDQIVTAKAGKESDLVVGSNSGSTFAVTFTATKENAYLIVKNSMGTVTLSNFTMQNNSLDEVTGEEIANGTWTLSEGGVDYLRTTAGWGSYIGSNGSVTITDPNSCRSTMTEIKGLTIGDTYCISFTGNGIVAAYVVLDYNSAYFNVDQIVTAKAGKENDLVIGSNSGSTFAVTFTATKENAYLVVKNSAGTVILSDFSVTKPDGPNEPEITSSIWWSTRGATYTISDNTVTWTSDPSWHSVYTELKGLKPNTKYEFSFDHNIDVNALEIVWLYTGAKSGMTLNAAGDRPAEFYTCEVTRKSNNITATFTTGAEESDYCFGIKVANANGLILDNITFGEWIAKEVTADDIVNGEWTLGEGGQSETEMVATNGWGKFLGCDGAVTITDPNSCRTSFIKVLGFVPGKEYVLTFNASGTESAAVVLSDGSAYIDINQSLRTVHGEEENVISAAAEGNRYTVRFAAKNNYIYLTVKNNAGTVTLSDFIFDPLKVSASTKWGGTVTVSPSDVVAQNTDVTFIANPNKGNYFVGWFDGEILVSTEKAYLVKVDKNISLTAVFDGKNVSSDDVFFSKRL